MDYTFLIIDLPIEHTLITKDMVQQHYDSPAPALNNTSPKEKCKILFLSLLVLVAGIFHFKQFFPQQPPLHQASSSIRLLATTMMITTEEEKSAPIVSLIPSLTIFVSLFLSEWPTYMQVFLHSVKYSNPKVSFLFLSNLNETHESWSTNLDNIPLPPNVKFLHFNNFTEIVVKADQALSLGFKIKVNTPYKLVDFLPALGQIFADELATSSHCLPMRGRR